MAEQRFIGAIDLGGTKILSLCLDASMRVVGQDQRPTDADRGPEAVVETMVASLRAAAAGRPINAVGVSTAGLTDAATGVVSVSPNLPGWHDVPLAQMLAAPLGLPVSIENDANAAALAAHRLGAGRGTRHLVFLAIGTGIGAGIVLNGALYRGASGAAGELGHMRLDPNGRACSCGGRGCLEAMSAGWALAEEAKELLAREPDGTLARLVTKAVGEPDARLLHDAAEAGDPAADAIIRRAGHYFGIALTNIVNGLNPELILIGGSLRKMGERYLGTAVDVMRREAFTQSAADVRVQEADLGDEAPALGAALLARDSLTTL